jgi:glycosyltransferase involved in cell wall biosynthesis
MEPVTASIIVPVYNRGTEITACLESLLAMDYQGFELIVVDDNSTDDTRARLHQFKALHPAAAITIVVNREKKGASGARNTGIALARGEYVAFTDSDCIVDRAWLRALVGGFSDPLIGAVAGTVIDYAPGNLAERARQGIDRIKQVDGSKQTVIGCNMGFRRLLARQYRFDTAMPWGCEEHDIVLRMRLDGHHARFIPTAVVQHNHRVDFFKYCDLGFRHGRASARFWYKHGIIGFDLLPLVAALLTMPLGLLDARMFVVPAVFLFLQLAAILYSEIAMKGKSFIEALVILPVCVPFYLCRAWGVLITLARITSGGERAIRESRVAWVRGRRQSAGRLP